MATFALFADDTNIFVTANNRIEAINKANKVLRAVSTFMLVNKLHINLEKSCFMHFDPRKRPSASSVTKTYDEPPVVLGQVALS